MTRPLQGLKVLEAATWGVGPLAATILADWGADVVKVEHPVTGDPFRGVMTARRGADVASDPPWHHVNRGKRSIGLDLAEPEARAVLHRLVPDFDVFVTNFPAPVRTRFEVDVEDIRARRADIIYARVTAFGPRGADSAKGGHDINAWWGRTGASYVAQRTADADYPPLPPVGAFGDYPTALILAGGITAAIVRRDRTGEPSVVDTSLYGSGIWAMAYSLIGDTEWQMPPEGGQRNVPNPLVNVYRTHDGRYIMLSMVQADRWWPGLCAHIERPDLVHDPRFCDFAARTQNRHALIEILNEVFATRTYADWCTRFETLDGPWTPVVAPSEVHDDPQAQANDYFSELDAGDGTPVRVVSVPVQFDEVSPQLTRGPELGEHTESVLLDAGLAWDEISALKDQGAIT